MKLERTSKSVQYIPVDDFRLQVELSDPIFSGDPLLELDDVLSIGLAPVSLDRAKWTRGSESGQDQGDSEEDSGEETHHGQGKLVRGELKERKELFEEGRLMAIN